MRAKIVTHNKVTTQIKEFNNLEYSTPYVNDDDIHKLQKKYKTTFLCGNGENNKVRYLC